ncbi:FAD-dependent oxidoreductase [Pseudonocardia acaciae]|uniref:FAD-dependent oxidoreductase n=1 Tax=Pseudonocardia acaciae TaxID=551276 RepID=UPI00056D2D54|nr:FAD-dependent oxidoreductase [Pseudonocardia acaciae]
MVPDVDVVVVGGGIGGLSCALALSRAGRSVRVLERSASFGEVGAGLQLAPNATGALREWGLLDQVIARGVLPERIAMRDALDGRPLSHLDLADVRRRYGAPYVVMHRGDLHEILLAACRDAGVDLVTDAEVRAVENGAGWAEAVGERRRDRAELVIAADGLTSTLRAQISADEPVSSNYVAYRGAIPITDVSGLADLAVHDVVVYIGPRCHLVQYALRGGEMFNQVAVFESPAAVAGQPEWGGPEELDAAFAPACDAVRAALPFLWRDRCWRMYDREPIPNWVRGRLALTGDAAHPMLQYLAQGACQAIEDADCLGALAAKDAGKDADWEAVLAGYNDARPRRTGQVQRRARAWGELWHADGLFRAVRNELLRERDPADYRWVDWLYAR